MKTRNSSSISLIDLMSLKKMNILIYKNSNLSRPLKKLVVRLLFKIIFKTHLRNLPSQRVQYNLT